MDAFNVPGEPLPRQAKDEAGDNDVAEGSDYTLPGRRQRHSSIP